MAESPGTLDGWFVLHDMRRIHWPAWKQVAPAEQAAILAEASAFLEAAAAPTEGRSAFYSMLGHRSDLMLLHLRPTLDDLNAVERAFARTRLADFTERTGGYLSVTELSLYEATARGGEADAEKLMQTPFVQSRLKPKIPELRYVCFYPMNKTRDVGRNWYTLDIDERRRMMRSHGSIGHKYHNIVVQMITGSMGLDDWEWGVTLWSDDAVQIKKLVYEMRFDEVSAIYAEFGEFQLGIRVEPGGLPALLQGSR